MMKRKTLIVAASIGTLAIVVATACVLWGTSAQGNAKPNENDQDEARRPKLLNVTKEWFAEKNADPALELSEEAIKGLGVTAAAVADAQIRPLPPQVGTLNYDNETMFLIKPRFNGELVSVAKVKDRIVNENGYEKIVERPLKFGDKVKQGSVLAAFWSVTLGTAKAAFVDAISAVRLSQETLDRHRKLYTEGAISIAAIKADERQLQGDNNALMTAERTLRMWKMSDDEIAALRKEANEILDSLLLYPTGRIIQIDAGGMTLIYSAEEKEGRKFKFAKECKFFRIVKRDQKEEIKEGVAAPVFQKLGRNGIGAQVMSNADGEVTEILVGKERDVLDEVNRWARTEVTVPWFDRDRKDLNLTVVEKNTNIGDIVDNTNFGTWLFRVADMSQLAIWVHPAEEYLPLIHEGLRRNGGMRWEIRFQSEPDSPPHVLPIDRIGPSLEPNQHNPMVFGHFPNKDHKYLAGQFVTATIFMPPEPFTVEIPTDAVNESKGQSFVFVKGKENPNEFALRRIAVVRRYADYTIVRSRLRDEDKRFSAEELKKGRYPLRTLELGESIVNRGVVELTAAIENAITRKSIELQQ